MSPLTKSQRQTLDAYVDHYEKRGVMGEWWDLTQAIKAALGELDARRFRAAKLAKEVAR